MLRGVAGRRTDAQARETRRRIVERAADIASRDGLDGITIGRLATDLELSKAGVLGHFGSKQELQLAALEYAVEVFRASVWEPARDAPPGLERLLAICEAWAAYAEDPPFSGGCFVATTSFEFATRAGRVHDELATVGRRWKRALTAEVEIAIEAGELPAESDADQIAFTLDAVASGTKPALYLLGDDTAPRRGLRAMRQAIGVDEAVVATR